MEKEKKKGVLTIVIIAIVSVVLFFCILWGINVIKYDTLWRSKAKKHWFDAPDNVTIGLHLEKATEKEITTTLSNAKERELVISVSDYYGDVYNFAEEAQFSINRGSIIIFEKAVPPGTGEKSHIRRGGRYYKRDNEHNIEATCYEYYLYKYKDREGDEYFMKIIVEVEDN